MSHPLNVKNDLYQMMWVLRDDFLHAIEYYQFTTGKGANSIQYSSRQVIRTLYAMIEGVVSALGYLTLSVGEAWKDNPDIPNLQKLSDAEAGTIQSKSLSLTDSGTIKGHTKRWPLKARLVFTFQHCC